MRLTAALILALAASPALAASLPVTLTLGAPNGPVIPADFSGLSYESSTVLPNNDGNHTFWAVNLPLQGVYKTLGIKCLRVGGNTVDRVGDQTTQADVDHL